jgi:phosphate transport system permease protein
VAPVSASDRVFRAALRGAGITVLAITGMILVFLLIRAADALRADGIHFFTQTQWLLQPGQFGIAAILPDGIIIAAIAMAVAVPVALATALRDAASRHSCAFSTGCTR